MRLEEQAYILSQHVDQLFRAHKKYAAYNPAHEQKNSNEANKNWLSST